MLDDLADAIRRHGRPGGARTAVPRMVLVHQEEALEAVDLTYTSMLCLVVSGAKRQWIGDQYDVIASGQVFLSLVDTPVLAAMDDRYLSVTIELDLVQLSEALPPQAPTRDELAFQTEADAQLIEAMTRWVGLLDGPASLRHDLAPLMEREILVRLSHGPLRSALRAALDGEGLVELRAALTFIDQQLEQDMTVDQIAAAAHISVSTLGRIFRAWMKQSPMQYRQIQRLRRARALLLSGSRGVADVASAVGYSSASQFSREYRQRYGVPPSRAGG